MSIWTPAREAQLIALWNAGSSAALIAWQFDTTPNAVIGKVYRLRIAGVDLRTDAPTKNLSPGQRAIRFGVKAMRAPRTSTQSAQAPSLPAPDSVDPHGAGPRTAHPPAQQTVQTVTQLPSIAPDTDSAVSDHPASVLQLQNGGAIEGLSVSLVAANADQCRFPIWPHTALPDHPDYGKVCGAPVAPDPQQSGLCSAPPYCAHHKSLCETPRVKQSRGNRLAARQVRAARYRESHAGGVA